jgi:uncharacterized membrane protein
MHSSEKPLTRFVDYVLYVFLAFAAIAQVLILASNSQAVAGALMKGYSIGTITVSNSSTTNSTLAWVAFALVAVAAVLAFAAKRWRLLATVGLSVLLLGLLFADSLPSVEKNVYPWVAGITLAVFAVHLISSNTELFSHKHVTSKSLAGAGKAN